MYGPALGIHGARYNARKTLEHNTGTKDYERHDQPINDSANNQRPRQLWAPSADHLASSKPGILST